MLCFSGFELNSRWVPLNNGGEVEDRSFLVEVLSTVPPLFSNKRKFKIFNSVYFAWVYILQAYT